MNTLTKITEHPVKYGICIPSPDGSEGVAEAGIVVRYSKSDADYAYFDDGVPFDGRKLDCIKEISEAYYKVLQPRNKSLITQEEFDKEWAEVEEACKDMPQVPVTRLFRKYTIYLDFDGTVVEHAYPKMGKQVPMAKEVIKKLIKAGHMITLNTRRADVSNEDLGVAFNYMDDLDIKEWHEVYACKPKIHPKPFYSFDEEAIFIDDEAPLIPLTPDSKGGMMVDWVELDRIFKKHNLY